MLEVAHRLLGYVKLTLIVMILVTGGPVQHPENLQDVAVTVITMELVTRAIEAED